MSDKQVLKLALEALEEIHVGNMTPMAETNWIKAITAIKEALAEPEQEPVAMRYDYDGYGWLYIDNGSGSNWREKIKNAEPLYTAPSKRKWVGLTDEEIDTWNIVAPSRLRDFVRCIEAKLREKNV